MEGLTRAPSLNRTGLEWLNVERPLRLEDLRGKLVILDFWTYCCINCIHMLATLKKVEDAFPDKVVVIGVHSPKFAAERRLENVRTAIQRLDIRHPVIHDPDMILWREYAVLAWPTLTLISPDGKVIGNMPGEANSEKLLPGIGHMLKDWEQAGVISKSHIPLSSPAVHTSRFRFPGKIKPVPGTVKRWALADSGHHQIVLLDDAGKELRRIGKGTAGLFDGSDENSMFNKPEGLIATEQYIFVADTGNHAIRRINLKDFHVETMAGTGTRGMSLGPPQPGGETALASPWDLEVSDHYLYFANAGTHQIGEIDLKTGTVGVLVGTGGESIIDGAPDSTLLAQPSGLSLSADRHFLYFVDSETSSVRVIDLEEAHNGMECVRTLIGTGLFDFGKTTGTFQKALLQHPLGLSRYQDGLAVVDSYNNRLCRLDLNMGRMEDIDLTALTCEGGTCCPLSEPAGIAWDPTLPDGARLLVSDTNNHRVLDIDLKREIMKIWAH